MGQLFTLDAATKAVITQGLDDLITELGKDCKLIYPPRMVNCTNCIQDPIGKKSSNHYLHGGPVPFSGVSTCPMCNGEFKIARENSESIKMLCAWKPRDFFLPVPNLNITIPMSYVQTKCYLKDLPKINRAQYLQFQVKTEGIQNKLFELHGEPGDVSNIIQDRYVVATWKRA